MLEILIIIFGLIGAFSLGWVIGRKYSVVKRDKPVQIEIRADASQAVKEIGKAQVEVEKLLRSMEKVERLKVI